MPEAREDAPLIDSSGFLGGRLVLRQPVQGHRAGTDAVLLAAAAPPNPCGLALDIGAGVGAAGLALATIRPQIRLGLVENDPTLAVLARENLAINMLSARSFVSEADVLSPASRRAVGLADQSAALVVTNPPFFDPSRTRLSPEPAKRQAHVMARAGAPALTDWIAASLALAEPGGHFILIHRPDALPVILEALAGRAGAITILPVHPRVAAPAIRVLVRAQKGSRAPLVVAPALVLHAGQAFTPLADAIHRGSALIEW